MFLRLSFLLALTTLSFAAPPASLPKLAPRDAGFSTERLSRIHDLLQGWVDRKQFAGVTVAVVRHGKLAYFETAGFADLEKKKPLEPGTIFRMHSMTKPIASAAVMILFDEGKLQLDDPLSKFIPGFEKVTVLKTPNGDGAEVVPANKPVTIKHLLTHTSGINNVKAYQATKTFDRGSTLEAMASKLPSIPLVHQPGEGWQYGMSIDVLGRVVEVASGKPFDVFLHERILKPLGMVDTDFFVPTEKLPRLSANYRLNESGALELAPTRPDENTKPAMLSGGGGLYGTASDYLRFCQMLLNGGELDGHRILSRKAVELMFMNQVPVNVVPANGPNNRTGYGFGFGGAVMLDLAATQAMGSVGEYQWGGAAGTFFFISPKDDLIGLLLVQRPPYVPGPGRAFKNLIYAALE